MNLIKFLLPIITLSFLPVNVLSQHNNLNNFSLQQYENRHKSFPPLNIVSKQNIDSLSVIESLTIKGTSGEQKYNYSYDRDGNLINELYQKWDGNNWENYKSWTYNYDTNGTLISELNERWKENNWVNDDFIKYTYDSNKNEISFVMQVWSDSQWINSLRRTSNYNFNGDIIFILNERWSESQWRYNSHESYLYDLNGHLIIHQKESPPIIIKWPYKERYTYTYDSLGYRASSLSENVVPGLDVWIKGAQYIYNYDSTGKMSSNVYETWGGDQWIKQTQVQYLYGLSEKVSQVLIDSWREEEWTILGRVNYSYDLNENMTFAIAEEWYQDNWKTWNYIFDFTDVFGREYNFFGSEINVIYTTITEVKQEDARRTEFSLNQNYPNPFNPTTTIRYSIPRNGLVKLTVYNTLGEEVSNLVNEEQSAGIYNVVFNASSLTSGIYFYTLQANDFVETKKLIFVK